MNETLLNAGEQPAAEPAAETPTDGGGVTYPDYLQDKFHKGTVDEAHKTLAESYDSLNKEFTQRNQALEGVNQDMFGAPKNDDGDVEYSVTMPEAFQDKFEVDTEKVQPLLDYAKENGMSQSFVDDVYSMYMHSQDSVDPETAMAAEMEALGEDGADRIAKIDQWSAANLSADERDALSNAITTADGVKAVEALINKSRNSPLPKGDVAQAVTHTQEEYATMLNAKDEWGQSKMRDPEYAKQTNAYAQSLDAQNKLQGMQS